jgi:hypothetical protein
MGEDWDKYRVGNKSELDEVNQRILPKEMNWITFGKKGVSYSEKGICLSRKMSTKRQYQSNHWK